MIPIPTYLLDAVLDTANPEDDHETNLVHVLYTLLPEDEQAAKNRSSAITNNDTFIEATMPNVDKHPEIEDKSKDNPPDKDKVNIDVMY